MTTESERPFADLPAALVDDVLQRAKGISEKLLSEFKEVQARRREWRDCLASRRLLRKESELPYVNVPTACGVDGAHAIERLLATDMVVAAAVAVEGLTPPSETRHWPDPRHLTLLETEAHEADTGTIVRALTGGMELELAMNAPHEVVMLDGSMTTPFIYFKQALNKASEVPGLLMTGHLLQRIGDYLKAYHAILSSTRSDRCWIALPKYTTRREIGEELGWPKTHDDRALLSMVLEPGEFTQPQPLKRSEEPWHMNLGVVPDELKGTATRLSERIAGLLEEIRVVYYRPSSWLPALRIEMSRAISDNQARLASVIHGVRHQCGTPGVMEPYPLYMADRMVKQLPRAIPTFRQVASQRIAETYQGGISDVFLGLHGYRTESGA